MNSLSEKLMDSKIDLPEAQPDSVILKNTSAKIGKRIGELLVAAGKMTLTDIDRILLIQKDKKISFAQAAKSLGLVTEEDITIALAEQFGYALLEASNKELSKALYAAYDPFGQKSEALRALRSQLLIRWHNKDDKTLALTSLAPEDKGAQLAANLAIMFSQLGKKTILIDANLRTPSQHQLFNLSNLQGLSNLLSGRAESIHIAQIAHFPNLSVLTSGPVAPNPLELLERPSFVSLLNELSAFYEVILIDTTPYSLGTDGINVAARAHKMLVTVSKDETTLLSVDQLMQQSKMSGIETVGFVLQEI